jgi:hypothetical protein
MFEHARPFSRLVVLLIAGFAVAVASGGCAHRAPPKPVVVVKKPVEPWFSARTFCTVPISDAQLPPTSGELAGSINTIWRKSVKLTESVPLVTMVGGRYPAVDAMQINLSGGVVIPGGKSAANFGDPQPGAPALSVGQFSLLAEPLSSRNGKMNVLVTATDVRFELQRTKEGRPFLVMMDAGEGHLHYDISVDDIKRVMLAMARETTAKTLVTVRSIDLQITSRGDRALDLDMHVSTLFGFVPAGLRFTCRVDVDDQMNATISNLEVEGDEIFGPLISTFIRPSLAKYDGKTRPLVGFPNQKLKLKDVRITTGERMTLDAVFGR